MPDADVPVAARQQPHIRNQQVHHRRTLMRKLELAAIMAVLLAAPTLHAQESGMEGHSGRVDLSILPQGCQDAIQKSDMSGMMQDMDMSGMESMEGMDEAQKASLQAMMEMNVPMMATHTIKDPDLAFYCGMIAHHTGAIAMAEVELKYGDDEASTAMAQKIIDAQGPEIEEMTFWVEEHAGQQ
ncbi:DUF305 domain-containing protein [Paracoccus benzoatiresistens]|uniref:DUF305 domain-containing protein n=1 Tax=Paracoccus benzoatiresistens TaxID=2997341 RepID=A0ABT4J9K0_9RHOB|nr:DUF305 domain-containing protein [Paracoccus sp. EF6]MCZ0963802.1 DUF305 domain-containing protein [Paracoccus sp. EF6]